VTIGVALMKTPVIFEGVDRIIAVPHKNIIDIPSKILYKSAR